MDPFSAAVSRLDIAGAVVSASKSNDLLPRRLEDKVGGRVGNRLSEALAHGMEAEIYEPSPAYFIQVPKRALTTRPAALLTFHDRTVYQSLVSAVADRIGKQLVSDRTLFGPRETGHQRSWSDFERAPLDVAELEHVVVADVAAFYDSISHRELVQDIIEATGRREIADALGEFLGRVMGSRRGLPQGLTPSDLLSTLFLAPVDRAMLRAGWSYFRRGDDFRVAVPNYARGREALATLERELRARGLSINSGKCRVLRVETYRSQLDAVRDAQEEFRERLGEERVARLYEMEEEELGGLAGAHGLEDLMWALYHGDVTSEDVIEQLESRLTPDDATVAAALFADAVARRPGVGDLSEEDFHGRLTSSLTILTAARDKTPLESMAELLEEFPDETRDLASYLAAMIDTPHGKEVVGIVERHLVSDQYRSPWQVARLFDVVLPRASEATDAFAHMAARVAAEEGTDWLVRAYAVRFLAARGDLVPDALLTSWNLAPVQFRSDLVDAAVRMAAHEDWAARFLEGVPADVVLDVVREDVQREVDQAEAAARARKSVGSGDYRDIQEGDTIHHAKWGRGMVDKISGDHEADITFEREGKKHILLEFAPVVRIGEDESGLPF